MVSVSGKSRATGCGRFTSTLFWLRTRRNSSRPNSSLTTDDTFSVSAKRSVSTPIMCDFTRTRIRVRPSIHSRSG